MLSGHIQGRMLAMLSMMIRPKNILEIGTYTGYSAICLAEGLTCDGHLYTIDINDELTPLAQKYITEAGLQQQITCLTGEALEVIPTIKAATFDLVFIDADKTNYANYLDMCIDKMNSGGFIIADNVLWSGKVTQEPISENDKDAIALHEFNEKVQQDDRLQNVLFPVRDGLMIIRKN